MPVPVGPFRLLHQEFSWELSPKDKVLLSKAATVMNALYNIHVENEGNVFVAITPQNGERVYEVAMSILIRRLYPDKVPATWQTYAYTTICKGISRSNPNKTKRAPRVPK